VDDILNGLGVVGGTLGVEGYVATRRCVVAAGRQFGRLRGGGSPGAATVRAGIGIEGPNQCPSIGRVLVETVDERQAVGRIGGRRVGWRDGVAVQARRLA